ncbi:MAG: AraC family transcriptional regulator [Bauldia sp.]
MKAILAGQKREPDVVSTVLRAVRPTSAIFYDNGAHAPWVSETPATALIARFIFPEAERIIPFHVITVGSCWAEFHDDSVAPVRLGEGDILLVPGGQRHVLGSSPGLREEPNLGEYERSLDGWLPLAFVINKANGPESCHFVCGFIGCDAGPFNPLLDALPRMVVARTSAADREWLTELVHTAVSETEDRGVGAETVLASLAEIMFVEVMRQHLAGLPEDARGWFSGLKDRRVGAALRLIHTRPAAPWTVARLAREVGMSRSGFAQRFGEYVGMSPIHYLGRWRMQLAVRTLARQGASVAQAAAEVGYESEAAFRRAFRKFARALPAAWRRRDGAGGGLSAG